MDENVEGHRDVQGQIVRREAEKNAVLPTQVRGKILCMVARGEHLTVTGATIILAEVCGILLG